MYYSGELKQEGGFRAMCAEKAEKAEEIAGNPRKVVYCSKFSTTVVDKDGMKYGVSANQLLAEKELKTEKDLKAFFPEFSSILSLKPIT